MKKTNRTRTIDLTAIHHIASRIVNHDNDYISRLMEEFVIFQPILVSKIVNFSRDLSPEESEEVISLYLIMWGVFRQYPECRETTITQDHFESVRERNISMFKYLDKEDDAGFFGEIVRTDLKKLNHGILMQYTGGCLQTWPVLCRMNINDYCALLIGVKSFIECMEEIVEREQNSGSREQRA
jgi:hypothetical protein